MIPYYTITTKVVKMTSLHEASELTQDVTPWIPPASKGYNIAIHLKLVWSYMYLYGVLEA